MSERFPIDLSDCRTAKKGRRFVVLLVDYFLLVILSFSVFVGVVQPLFSLLPSTTSSISEYTEKSQEVIDIISSTHLQTYDSDSGRLVSTETGGKSYLTNLMKTSFYINNPTNDGSLGYAYQEEDEQGKQNAVAVNESDTFLSGDSLENKDNLGYYFRVFKKENSIGDYQYNGTDLSNQPLLYLNKAVLLLDSTNKDLVNSDFDCRNDVFYLNPDTAHTLMAYINLGDGNGETTYTRLLSLYQSAVKTGINEVQTLDQTYIDTYNIFLTSYNSYIVQYDWALLLSYLIGFLICYLVFPLCFKHGRTIGYRFFGLASYRNDERPPVFWNYLVKDIVLFILQLSALFFSPLFLGKINILSVGFLVSVSLFQILFFSFCIALVSLAYFFINKDNLTLSDLASLTHTVNIHKHEEEDVASVFSKRK
jgi:hypothetical protein